MRQYYASDKKKREEAKRKRQEQKRLRRMNKRSKDSTQTETPELNAAGTDPNSIQGS